METWVAICARRNVRTYTDERISDADLTRILQAGWRTPSASNRQHWAFVVVTEPGTLTELSTVWDGARHLADAAAAIVLAVPEPPDDWTRVVDFYDLGQATFAMMLAATDLGVGSGHSAVGEHARAREILDMPATHKPLFMLALGYPADRPLQAITKLNRRPFDEVVHRESW